MNPLGSIWLKPRATVREIASSRPGYFFVPLAGVYGAAHNLNKVVSKGVDPSQGMSAPAVLGLNLFFGFLFGVVALYGTSFPLSWVGRMLGGVARPHSVRTVLGLASVPFAPLLAVAVGLTLLGPSTLLVRDGGSALAAVAGTHWTVAVVFYFMLWGVLAVWLCVIGVIGLSEVHAFSVGRSIATYLIVVGVLLAVFMVVITAVVKRSARA